MYTIQVPLGLRFQLNTELCVDKWSLHLSLHPTNIQMSSQIYPSTGRKYKCTFFLVTSLGVLPYSLGGGVPLGSRKSYPLLDQIFQFLWPSTRPKMLNYSCFLFLFQCFASDPVKRDPILDQISIITRPFTRLNGSKTIPSTRPSG